MEQREQKKSEILQHYVPPVKQDPSPKPVLPQTIAPQTVKLSQKFDMAAKLSRQVKL